MAILLRTPLSRQNNPVECNVLFAKREREEVKKTRREEVKKTRREEEISKA